MEFHKSNRPRKFRNASGVARPVVSSQPNYTATAYSARASAINPSSIVSALSIPPVQESIIPIAMAAFPGYTIEVEPPEGATWTEQKLAEAKKGLKLIDKRVKGIEQVRWSFYDTISFRHYLGSYSLTTEGNWTIPETFDRLPPESFGKSPSGVTRETSWIDPLLKGITIDRKTGQKHYYQSQDEYGEPIDIPEEELLHIFWELPGNQSIMASMMATIDFWQFSRKCLGLSAQRQAVPNAVATFDLEAAKWLSDVLTDGEIKNGMPSGIWDIMDEIVKSQSIGTAYALPVGGKLEYPSTSGLEPAQTLDQYIERKIILHLIPTHILDTLGSSLSKSSQPALDLFNILSRGWREVCCQPFESWYADLLVEHNGFDEGLRVWFEWDAIVQEDKVSAHNMAIQDVVNGIATINEVRKKAGYTELDEAGVTALIDEHNRLMGNAGLI